MLPITKDEAIRLVCEHYSLEEGVKPRYVVLDTDGNGEKWWRIIFVIEATDRLAPKYDYLVAEVHTITGDIIPQILL